MHACMAGSNMGLGLGYQHPPPSPLSTNDKRRVSRGDLGGGDDGGDDDGGDGGSGHRTSGSNSSSRGYGNSSSSSRAEGGCGGVSRSELTSQIREREEEDATVQQQLVSTRIRLKIQRDKARVCDSEQLSK